MEATPHPLPVHHRPKRHLYVAQVVQIGETEHIFRTRKGVRTKKVPIYYQLMVNGSRYPFAHSHGFQHPGWGLA